MRPLVAVITALAVGCGAAAEEDEEGIAVATPERTAGCAAAAGAGAAGARLPAEVAGVLPGEPVALGSRKLPGGGVQATAILEAPLPTAFVEVVERAGLAGWEYAAQELERGEGVGELLLTRDDRSLDLRFAQAPDCTGLTRVVALSAYRP